MSIATEIDTQTIIVRVRVAQPVVPPTNGEFADQFLDLESLVFVSALIALVRPQFQIEPGEFPVAAADWDRYIASVEILPEIGTPEPLFSSEGVNAAFTVASLFRVVSVTYASPIDIVMVLASVAPDHSAPIAITTALIWGAAGSFINLWRKFSHGRFDSAQADIAEAEARIKIAEAREAESTASVRESEDSLRIEAHHLIRAHLGTTHSIHGADSGLSNRTASGPDPRMSRKALDRELDRAVCALIKIEEVRIERR